MNREILFRGINFQKEWVYGDLYHSYANNDMAIAYYREGSKTPTFDAVFSESVGQYTGLKDKNGKKIFEGDIVKIGQQTALVKWNEELATFALQFDFENKVGRKSLGEWDDTTVIGNIHDNPGLIKQRV